MLYRVRISDAVRVPALRERTEDIPLLVEHFVRKYERAFKDGLGARARSVSREAMEALCDADWSGNVRGLEQAVEAAVYRFPKLRIMSLGHLRLPDRPSARHLTIVEPPTSGAPRGDAAGRLKPLLCELRQVEFDPHSSRGAWAGKLPELQETFAFAAAGLLKAALVATRRPTPDNPEGEIKFHPAVKLAMGDEKISASKAADVVKRVLSIVPEVHALLMKDEVLASAYSACVRLRPKRNAKRKGAPLPR
jgi:hypothetical protein